MNVLLANKICRQAVKICNSVKPFVSKVIERVVDNQLRSHMSENDLFECMQSAYRANHSTETALVRVLNDILLAVDKKQMVGMVYYYIYMVHLIPLIICFR